MSAQELRRRVRAAEPCLPALRDAVILGVDPGTLRCGWGMIRSLGGRLIYLASGVIEPPAKYAIHLRLRSVFERLDEMATHHRPAYMAVEQAFVGKDPRAALRIGAARGVAMLVAARAGATVEELMPSTVKKAVTGRGGASKEDVAAMVARLLRIERPASLDESDALAVAIARANGGAGCA